jgi:hypothetical protein
VKDLFKTMNSTAVKSMSAEMNKARSGRRDFEQVHIYGCSFVPSLCILLEQASDAAVPRHLDIVLNYSCLISLNCSLCAI